MPTIRDFEILATVAAWEAMASMTVIFVVWCVVIYAVALAIFEGYPGQWIKHRIYKHRPILMQMPRMNWELASKHAWNIRMELTPMFYVPRKLDDTEYVARLSAMDAAMIYTRWHRRALQLIGCRFCQCTWISFGVMAATVRHFDLWYSLATAVLAAYMIVYCEAWGKRIKQPYKKENREARQLACGHCGNTQKAS